jgi:hypothetical protein
VFITLKIPLFQKPSQGSRDQFYNGLVKLCKSKFGNDFAGTLSHYLEVPEGHVEEKESN